MKRMPSRIGAFVLALSLVAVVACRRSGPVEPLSLATVQREVKVGMTLPELAKKIGPPLRDIGSGIHIYVYNIDDGTQLLVGYTDRVLYARQVTGTGMTLVQTIVEEGSSPSAR